MVSIWRISVLFPIFFGLLWNLLDASPTLFLYDKIASITGGWHLNKLKGKTIWLTGASSGIGASMVCELMKANVGHLILSSRNREKLESVANKCKEKIQSTSTTTTKISIIPYDATNETSTEDVVENALKAANNNNNNIDMIILNAGVYQNKPALQTNKSERDWITRVNYQAPVDLTEELIKRGRWKKKQEQQQQQQKQKQKQHHIVVVASLMAHGPHGLSSSYAASKAALRNYFFSLSSEEASWLRVDISCPGVTDTGLWDNGTSKPAFGGGGGSGGGGGGGGAAMASDRVAHLILTGVAGPHVLFYETWISKFAGLIWIWLTHYAPSFSHFFVHLLGYVRVPVWEKEKN